MARAYSLDLRERVVAAVAAGESCRAVATKFKVSVASVVKWSQRFRATGSAAAYKVGGRRPYPLAGERDWLLARLAEKPDITLRALGAELAARGIKVSHFAVWHFFEHEGISFKKSLQASEQDRPDVARRRTQWRKYQGRLDPSRLVFIDDTWVKTNMTRTPAATPRSPPPAFVEPCIPTLADRRRAAKNGDGFAPPHDQPSRQGIAHSAVRPVRVQTV